MPSSLAAAVYESIVAAIYLDGGFEVARSTSSHDAAEDRRHLVEHAPAELQGAAPAVRPEAAGATPMYELLDEKGPDHSKCFEVCA
jgi:ribonuclease-3